MTLRITDLRVEYGAVTAVRGLTLEVAEGEVVALVGANGAGKSSLLKTISGLVEPVGGSMTFDGVELRGMPAPKRVRHGIVQVLEGRGMFPDLSVVDNLLLGTYTGERRKARRGAVSDGTAYVFEIFPVLADRRRQTAETLSGGEQQMLAIARALLAEPRLILLDEPTLGIAPVIIEQLIESLVRLADAGGPSILIAEQNADFATRTASRLEIMRGGEIVKSTLTSAAPSGAEMARLYFGST